MLLAYALVLMEPRFSISPIAPGCGRGAGAQPRSVEREQVVAAPLAEPSCGRGPTTPIWPRVDCDGRRWPAASGEPERSAGSGDDARQPRQVSVWRRLCATPLVRRGECGPSSMAMDEM